MGEGRLRVRVTLTLIACEQQPTVVVEMYAAVIGQVTDRAQLEAHAVFGCGLGLGLRSGIGFGQASP